MKKAEKDERKIRGKRKEVRERKRLLNSMSFHLLAVQSKSDH